MGRSSRASAVIVGTVALSLAGSFGLSVLLWQLMIGIPVQWMVLPMSVIVLLAVGSDYNLMLRGRRATGQTQCQSRSPHGEISRTERATHPAQRNRGN
ncbi:hypothetical protein A5685_25340 [Mycobacterium colombiense]|uniref:Membrane transport protein MMPL domain-containing protein n=1 Tax=Mycobacterium colombiense TaxID=339268 RepID=A0A1A2SBW2_9MYCO|nr:hypothetical protein A5685_25340 [Mycobacterium colombiense]